MFIIEGITCAILLVVWDKINAACNPVKNYVLVSLGFALLACIVDIIFCYNAKKWD